MSFEVHYILDAEQRPHRDVQLRKMVLGEHSDGISQNCHQPIAKDSTNQASQSAAQFPLGNSDAYVKKSVHFDVLTDVVGQHSSSRRR
ncbi:hypothetical protein [uncultured Pelagimonas sp.]|uniref:hypothetical protein n=1 Tax=uncultured Pelagimonas sp. TaxID=1618102 RepID=UPI00262E3EAF|nr:hypothetical protein [uncultured Pelagimonas sp.]